jgi:hypothetical protein
MHRDVAIGIMSLLLVQACASDEWTQTSYPGFYARSRISEHGITTELRSSAGALVATMNVDGQNASWRDAQGISRRLVVTVGNPAGAPPAGSDETSIWALPSEERSANETLYLVATLTGEARTARANAGTGDAVPYRLDCQNGPSCTSCCDGYVCCWFCDDGSSGCGRQIYTLTQQPGSPISTPAAAPILPPAHET